MALPVADDDMEVVLQKLRTSNGTTGFKGVINAKPNTEKPFQARVYDKDKKAQRPIPGLYCSAEEAARAAIKFIADGCQGRNQLAAARSVAR